MACTHARAHTHTHAAVLAALPSSLLGSLPTRDPRPACPRLSAGALSQHRGSEDLPPFRPELLRKERGLGPLQPTCCFVAPAETGRQ